MFQKLLSHPILKLIPFFLFFLYMVFLIPNSAFFFSGAESMVLDSGYYDFDPSILIRHRILNLLLLSGVIGVLFLVFKALFGLKIAIPSIIFLLTSSWVFLIGYSLSFDHLLALYHSALFLTLLYYSRRQSYLLLGLIFILSLGALLIDALGTTLFLSVLFFGAVRQQKISKIENYFWLTLLLLAIALILMRFKVSGTWMTFLGIQTSDYLLFYGLVLMALWPFTGFIFAAFKDAIIKWKKGDYWSIWVLTATFAAIISQSPSFILPVSLFIGKHVMDYDLENYPFKHIIKYWTTFLWVIWFFLSIVLMTGGHLFQSEGGFRMGFQLGFGIWVFGLISIIGMYGKHFYLMRFGLLGGNLWVTYSLFILLIPYFGEEFLLNKVWKKALNEKSNIEVMTDTKQVAGLNYTLKSIALKNFKTNKYLVSKKEFPQVLDSLNGFSANWRKETWYFVDSLPSGSNNIK